jgi:hypothetical protein
MIEIGPNLMEAIKALAVAIPVSIAAWALCKSIKHW